MRRSGKRALIQLEQNWTTTFDLSGLSSDGVSRSNEFQFEIAAEVKEGVSGYNEKFGESVPIGQSGWTASIKSFFDHRPAEINKVLRQMFEYQHNADVRESYDHAWRLIVMPDGNVSGYEKWTLHNAVIKTYAPDFPHDDIMTLAAQFSGGKWQCDIIP
jgi:hypothetical protein